MCQLPLWRKTAPRGLSAAGLLAILIVAGLGLSELFSQENLNESDAKKAPIAPRRFEVQIQTSEGKPVVGATVRPWAVGHGAGSFLVKEQRVPATKSDAEGKATIVFPEDAELADD